MDILKGRLRKTRFFLRWSIRLGFVSVLVLVGVFLGSFPIQIYHHFFLFPKQAAQWKERAAERKPVELKNGWNEYRGVMHSHSEVSHDSEVTIPEITAALKKADCQFICMSDHYVDGKADYSLGKKGLVDGILFIRGFEMNDGLMPWGLPDNTVFTKEQSSAEVAKKVRELGGVTSVSHAEAWRPWDIQQLDAMEIYNIHTDLIFKGLSRYSRDEVAKEFLMNFRSYGDQTLRYMCDETVLMLLKQKWDQQNLRRRITGIAANDIHQNVGLRGIYTDHDTFLLLDTGHNDPAKCVKEIKLNFLTKMLLSLCLGPLEPGKQLFRIDCDPYERSARFVNTHLLAKDLSERALIDAIRGGRAFVAFNMIGDATGFAYVAQAGEKKVTMGGQISLLPDLKLLAESPLPCKFTLMRNGEVVTTQEGRTFEYEVKQPGKYRIEAGLPAVAPLSSYDAWDSWVIANPIDIVPAPAVPATPPNAATPPQAPTPAAATPAQTPAPAPTQAAPPAPAQSAPNPPAAPAAPVAPAAPAPAPSAMNPPAPPAAPAEVSPPTPAPTPAPTPPPAPAAPAENAPPAPPAPSVAAPPAPPAPPAPLAAVAPPAPAPAPVPAPAAPAEATPPAPAAPSVAPPSSPPATPETVTPPTPAPEAASAPASSSAPAEPVSPPPTPAAP